MNKQKAFSLTVTIVAIAVATLVTVVGYTTYKEYSSKTKIEEINILLGAQLNAWAENNFQGQTKDVSVGTLGKYLTAVALHFASGPSGVNQVVGTIRNTGTPLDSKTLVYTASINSNNTTWKCYYPGPVDLSKYLSSECTCKGC